jgi:hypothetical protein
VEIRPRTLAIAAGVILLVFLGIAGAFTLVKSSYDQKIVELQNAVAARDQTIETQKGVYQKLAIQSNNLQDLLGTKDEQLKLLQAQLKKSGDDLLTATTLVVKLKKDLLTAGNVVVQPTDPTNPGMIAAKFDSLTDFDPFRVHGTVVTDCANRTMVMNPFVLSQERPLRLSVVVSQGPDKTWRTSTTSSEANFQVDIALAAVNPYMLEPKWYEKIGMSTEIGVGSGPGFLAGVGVHYQIGKFEVGPKAWVVIDRAGVNPYFGANLLWHPFQR